MGGFDPERKLEKKFMVGEVWREVGLVRVGKGERERDFLERGERRWREVMRVGEDGVVVLSRSILVVIDRYMYTYV